eukprot:RCo009626
MQAPRGAPAAGFLLDRSKVTLFSSDDKLGYLCAASLTSAELRVEAFPEGQPPRSFERCVFTVFVEKSRKAGASAAPAGRCGTSGDAFVRYGDRVRLYHSYSDSWLVV